jgi:hypothetical protein
MIPALFVVFAALVYADCHGPLIPGLYGGVGSGEILQNGVTYPVAATGYVEMSANGLVTGWAKILFRGTIAPVPVSGSYNVTGCSFSADLLAANVLPITLLGYRHGEEIVAVDTSRFSAVKWSWFPSGACEAASLNGTYITDLLAYGPTGSVIEAAAIKLEFDGIGTVLQEVVTSTNGQRNTLMLNYTVDEHCTVETPAWAGAVIDGGFTYMVQPNAFEVWSGVARGGYEYKI